MNKNQFFALLFREPIVEAISTIHTSLHMKWFPRGRCLIFHRLQPLIEMKSFTLYNNKEIDDNMFKKSKEVWLKQTV